VWLEHSEGSPAGPGWGLHALPQLPMTHSWAPLWEQVTTANCFLKVMPGLPGAAGRQDPLCLNSGDLGVGSQLQSSWWSSRALDCDSSTPKRPLPVTVSRVYFQGPSLRWTLFSFAPQPVSLILSFLRLGVPPRCRRSVISKSTRLTGLQMG
jgi:hypothetical protein